MYICLLRPPTLTQVIMELMKVVYIGLKIPSNIPQVISEVADIGQVLPATVTLLIVEGVLIEVYICNKITSSLPLSIGERYLMLKGEMYISQTSHYSSHNQGERGRFLDFSVDNVDGDGNM